MVEEVEVEVVEGAVEAEAAVQEDAEAGAEARGEEAAPELLLLPPSPTSTASPDEPVPSPRASLVASAQQAGGASCEPSLLGTAPSIATPSLDAEVRRVQVCQPARVRTASAK